MQYLRSVIVSGDFHLAAVVACTLSKLVLRLEEDYPSKVEVNKASTESSLVIVSLLQPAAGAVLLSSTTY